MKLHHHDPHRAQRASAPQIADGTEPRSGLLSIVAYVDRYPPYQNAGGEWALHGMLAPLAARGHRVSVATLCKPNGSGSLELDGVQVWPDEAAAALMDQADVLVSHLLWTKRSVQAATHGQLPLVYLFHNDFTIGHWHLTPDNVTALVYNAGWIRRSIVEKNPTWDAVPNVVVRPPVWPERYQVEGNPFDREFVTLVNPNQLKGAPVFYDLARARRGERFLAVEGAYGTQVRPKAGDRNVTWQRHTAEMREQVYARTRVLLMPSEYESYGRAGVEAMCSGIPVIATPTPGLRESLGSAGLFANRPATARRRRSQARSEVPLWEDWNAHLDCLLDPNRYAVISAEARCRAADLAARSVAEIDRFEMLLRVAANAERVESHLMAGHDPYRAKRANRQNVDIAAEAPAVDLGGTGSPDPVGGPKTGTQGPLPADEAVIVEVVDQPGTVTPTEKGAGPDGDQGPMGDAGGPAEGQGNDAPTSEPADTGDGPSGQDAGGPPPEPAPTSTAPDAALPASAPPSEAAPGSPASGAAELPDDPRVAALVPQVPTNAVEAAAWIKEPATEAEQYDRADAAEWVEKRRDGKPRKTVMAVVADILYDD